MDVILFTLGTIAVIAYFALLYFVAFAIIRGGTVTSSTQYKNLPDQALVEIFASTFRVHEYKIFEAAEIHKGYFGYRDRSFKNFIVVRSGNVPKWVRDYMLEVLEGKIPFEGNLLA